MEFVLAGEKLQDCRTAFLDRVAHAKKVLILGEGNGRFLRECRLRLPKAQIMCVDASAQMLASARKRANIPGHNSDDIKFIHADALTWAPAESDIDLFVTHFFLDCFRPEQLKLLIAKLTSVAAPRANWLLADFQAAASGLQRQRSRIILWMMYRFFRVATRLPAKRLTPPDALLEAHGFELRERRESDWGLLHSDWWQRKIPT